MAAKQRVIPTFENSGTIMVAASASEWMTFVGAPIHSLALAATRHLRYNSASMRQARVARIRMVSGFRRRPVSLLRPVAPEPAERIGKDGPAVLPRVTALAEHKGVIVAHELERRRHVLLRERPVTMQVVEIVAAILQEHAERLGGFSLPDQRRVNV